MPTISPVARAVIGGNSEEAFRQPRASVTRSTGMDLPPVKETKIPDTNTPQTAPKTGQSDITEETDPKAVTLSPQLTALARKQQKLQSEIQAQRDREAAFAEKEKDYIPRSSFKAKAEVSMIEALQEIGYSYEDITNKILEQTQSDDPYKKLEAEIKDLKSSQQENVSKQYEATVNQYRKEIKDLVSSDESFVTIKEEQAEEAVLQHILETFKSDGEVLTVEEASKDIEEFLVDEAIKKANLTKVKAKLAPATETSSEKRLPPPKSVPKTLTEQVTSAPTRTYGQFQHLSMKERIAQAMARAQK